MIRTTNGYQSIIVDVKRLFHHSKRRNSFKTKDLFWMNVELKRMCKRKRKLWFQLLYIRSNINNIIFLMFLINAWCGDSGSKKDSF